MKTITHIIYSTFAVFTLACFAGTVAPAATITVLETFDFPGTGKNTLPESINDNGVIVGIVVDRATGVSRGFLRARSGNFSNAFVEPNDTGGLTEGSGINDAKVVCGDYLNGADGTFHGYRLFHGNFKEFDVAGALDTVPLGVNNAGDFCGSVVLSDGTSPAFLSLSGSVTTFNIPDATATGAHSINSSRQVVGYYIDAAGVLHGYFRDSDGTLTFPIDPAGSTQTILFANNDSNWVVGRYVDGVGVTHGLFFRSPNNIMTFDYPGAAGFTSLNGINQNGYVSGRYLDAAGIAHGFLGIIGSGTDQLEQSKSPVRGSSRAAAKAN